MRNDRKAHIMLEEYWDMHIPVDVQHIAESMGWSIVKSDLKLKNFAVDFDNHKIVVNQMLTDTKLRHVIANAIGCIVYDYKHYSIECDVNRRIENFSSEKDQQMSLFARTLLMPAEAIKAVVDVRDIKDPVKIRTMFDVSALALYTRLKELGYFL